MTTVSPTRDPVVAASHVGAIAQRKVKRGRRGVVGLYMELTKARLSSLVLMTTAVGFLVAPIPDDSAIDWMRMLWTMIGTALCAASANAFNQVIEIRLDAKMHRTMNRPLPGGHLRAPTSFVTAMIMGYLGVGMLALLVNLSAAALALSTILIYVLLYTPLKTRSTLNTLVGAVCGAIPPMIGWVAASGRIDPGAWVLAAILFVWQIPHFLALAWLYREDYARGGFAMLPAIDGDGRLTGRVILVSCMMLMMVALGATLFRIAGPFYAAGSLLIGLWWLILCVRLHLDHSNMNARWVFVGSLIYLPVVLCLMMCDRYPTPLTAPDIHMVAAGEMPAD